MSLYQQWNDAINEGNKQFVNHYLATEQNIYADILARNDSKLTQSIKALAEKYSTDPVVIMGFLDGINDSLTKENDLESFDESTVLNSEINFKELFLNMNKVKATWLYELEEWDNVLTKEERKQIRTTYIDSVTAKSNKIGRNEPCTCGSGKKYKKCCGA